MKKCLAVAMAAAALFALPAIASAAGTTHSAVRVKTIAVGRTGVLRVGEVLRAPRFSGHVRHYQWLLCNFRARHCVSIPGATKRTYRVRQRDIGHRFRVAAVLQGNTVAVSAPTAIVGLPLPVNTAIPTLQDNGAGGGTVGDPTAANANVLVGDVLTGTSGTWKYAVGAFDYQWQLCNPNVPPTGAAMTSPDLVSATNLTGTLPAGSCGEVEVQNGVADPAITNSYTIQQGDVGFDLVLQVTAYNYTPHP